MSPDTGEGRLKLAVVMTLVGWMMLGVSIDSYRFFGGWIALGVGYGLMASRVAQVPLAGFARRNGLQGRTA